MASRLIKIFLVITVITCHIYGKKNKLPDCMRCLNLKDSLLTVRCFDTLKGEYDKFEKMSLHYNFCLDSALSYLSSKSQLSSIEKNLLEYLQTGCQSYSDYCQVKKSEFMNRDTFYFYKDRPFHFEPFLFSGLIATSIGIGCTILAIDNLKNLKRKNYEWDLINAKSIDKTIGIVSVVLVSIIDAGGIGLTTFGTFKAIEEKRKLRFLKNLQFSNNNIRIIIDY